MNRSFIKVRSVETETSNAAIRNLRQDVADEVKRLSVVKSHRSLLALAFSWSIVFLCIYLTKWSNSFYIYFLSIPIIASRQHSLFALTHEATHRRLFKNGRLNDWVAEIFTAYPLFIKMRLYRDFHLAHHSYLNTDKDPSWINRIVYKEWQYPMERAEIWKYNSKYLKGAGVKDTWLFIKIFSGLAPKDLKNSDARKGFVSQVLFYIFLVAVLTLTKTWLEFLLFWVIPAITVLPVIMKLRDVAEHFGLPNQHELNATRNVVCSWWENFFIVPLNASYHLDHHLFPSVPFFNLKKLHKVLLQQPWYSDNAHNNTSYINRSPGSMVHELVK